MQLLDSQLLLPDVTLERYDKRLVIKSEVPLRTLSSAVYRGGRQDDIRSILNLTVHKGYRCSDPAEDLKREIRELGLPDQSIGLMTAVDVKNGVVAFESVGSEPDSPLLVVAVVTAGSGNAWRAGTWPSYLGQEQTSALNPFPYPLGTINMVVLIDGTMTDAAMVNAIATVTEVKTAIFYERGIRCPGSGQMATGTTTDAVVIATTGRGQSMEYGGPGTVVGTLIAQAVTKALNEALDIYDRGKVIG
ncbi:adenosylcobinamide amidohydrolase [Effusibacillus consociatus]|uniref:Adenosylcobinamide amidohydrolase n=1 Tax=Effusibacillus consociatus TaxID=1117041 RepID=A0ABV9PYG4_9BACL